MQTNDRGVVHFIVTEVDNQLRTKSKVLASFIHDTNAHPSTLGWKIVHTLSRHDLVVGMYQSEAEKQVSNGPYELPLWYILDHKSTEVSGEIYLTDEHDISDYNYFIYIDDTEAWSDQPALISGIEVRNSSRDVLFNGPFNGFISYLENEVDTL